MAWPPREIWRAARRKLVGSWKRHWGWFRAQLFGTRVTNADLLRALDDRFANTQMLVDHLGVTEEPFFFLEPTRRQMVVDSVRAASSAGEGRTILAADQVCEHVFDLLGSGPTHLGPQIDWHVDFKTGYRFDAQKYYADVRPAPYPGGYDIKVPWELSRCQHFTWLGQAYWFTQDEKYAREFVDQVLDWIQHNRPQFGVNWACTMDVAIRAVNWLWGYHYFKNSPSLDREFLLTLYRSLLDHGRHIFRNLEHQGSFTGNHYLSDLVGLVYLGLLCPEFKEARNWREFSLQELEKEMSKQVYPDGVDFEASTSYHRLAAEMFLSATLVARLNGHTFSQEFMERLEKMFEFMLHVTKPDGTAPLIGDNDNGRLHRLKVWDPPEREWVDFRYLLAIGAVLFERKDFAGAAGDQWEESIWLLGEEAPSFTKRMETRKVAPLQPASRAFPDAGLYIMRHKDSHLVVGAGPNGQNGNGGHAHNDKLSFELYAKGQSWIVDPGAYVYTADYEARNQFRSTAFHNTVQVGSQEQNPLASAQRDIFRLPDITQSRATHWIVDRDFVLFAGEHYGYRQLDPPVLHRRIVFLDKVRSIWIVHDQLSARGQHQAVAHLHFAPDLDARPAGGPEGSLCTRVKGGKSEIRITVLQGSSGRPRLSTGVVSSEYGRQESAPVATWQWDPESNEFVLAITEDVEYTGQITAAYHRYREVYKDVVSQHR